MKKDKLVENIIRRLLRESQEEREERGRRRMLQSSGLAVYAIRGGVTKTAILYEPEHFRQNIDEVLRGKYSAEKFILHRVMRGIIEIRKPRNPCNGAWEVKLSAVKNPGDGGLIYGLGFAMSSTGILMPDRGTVSQRAQQGWIKQKSRGGKPFDDVEHPMTTDTSDDCFIHNDEDMCKVHVDEDMLNRSYEEEGWESGLFSRLEETHEETMDMMDPDDVTEVLMAMADNVENFFVKYYHSHG